MTDHYETLGLPRRLVLAEEELRAAYGEHRRAVHPDAGGGTEEFRKLQEAYATLKRPARRLRHWLELENGKFEPGGAIPDEVTNLFPEIGRLMEQVAGLGRQKAAAKTAVAKAMVEREGVQALAEVERLQGEVERLHREFSDCFGEIEADGASQCRIEAGMLARGLAFLEKWEDELRDAGFGLIHGS